MVPEPLHIDPPDDTGAVTFGRYRYQARLMVMYCVACALGRNVRSVVAEHIEDIAVEGDGHWTFIQIKTRDPGLGQWRLVEVLPPGKGLKSLYRAFQVVRGTDSRFELHLEGEVKRDDLLAELLEPFGPRSAELRLKIAERLEIEEAECAVFLDRLCVREMPSRGLITQYNLALMGELAPGRTAATIRAIHEGLVEEISRAMEADEIGDGWPTHVIAPHLTPDSLAARVAAKRLTPERIEPLCTLLKTTADSQLLRSDDVEAHDPSDLVRKLTAGGADAGLISTAITLRSNAVRAEIEFMSKNLVGDDAKLDDVKTRLLLAHAPLPGIWRGQPNSAAQIFQSLKTELQTNAEAIDRHWVFGRDPALLLGELCELSDQCKAGWS
ncbi:MAG TPA: dsDNA nuclease domain-containing protein [Longimicrobium sp.]